MIILSLLSGVISGANGSLLSRRALYLHGSL